MFITQHINSIQFAYQKHTTTTAFLYMMPIKKDSSDGACIYFRNYLPLKLLKTDSLQESVTCELQVCS